MNDDPFDLKRFVDAQARVYDRVLAELRAGEKTSHWIWFIFPQRKGLGRSFNSTYFGIGSLDEARAYLAHELLSTRLRECVALVLAELDRGSALADILGDLDAQKFKSCLSLFSTAAPDDPLFTAAHTRIQEPNSTQTP
jgi:uncharacterized protein (DUF1810 family)